MADEVATHRQSHRARSGTRLDAAISLLLIASTALVYLQTLHHDFVNYDDDCYVYNNRHVRGGLSLHGLIRAFTHSDAANWHPLTWMSHMVDCHVFGRWAGGHHLTSSVIHAAVAVVLYFALRQLTHRRWPSAIVAAVFVTHPLRVESVAWIAERKDVLSGLFFVLTLVAYGWYVRDQRSLARYLLVCLFCLLGLMCKPMLVSLPLVLLLLDYWPLGRCSTEGGIGWQRVLRLVLEKAPLFALSFLWCVLTLAVQETAKVAASRIGLSMRLTNAVTSCAMYLYQLVWPVRLAAFYSYPRDALPWGMVAGSLVLLIGISWVAFLQRSKRPYLIMGWIWYLVMLAPVIGLVQVGMQARADRYTYLPLVGPCLAVVWMLDDLWNRRGWPRSIASAIVSLVIASMVTVAWRQTSTWRDSTTLWNHALAAGYGSDCAYNNLACIENAKGNRQRERDYYELALSASPDSVQTHINYGLWLVNEGRHGEGIAHYRTALEICPRNAIAEANLGLALVALGNLDQATIHLRRATRFDPGYTGAYYNLGKVYASLGRYSEAANAFEQALRIDPEMVRAANNLANVLRSMGRSDEAIAWYHRAIESDPEYAEACYNLGLLLDETKQNDEARQQFQRALEINPAYAEAHDGMGVLLLNEGRPTEAIPHFRAAIEINPTYHLARAHLGLAYSRLGRSTEAVIELRRFLRIQPNQPQVVRSLAWILATASDRSVRSGKESIELATRAMAAEKVVSPQLLDTLAAAYAEAGRFQEAVETAEKAKKAAETMKDQALAAEIDARLKLYQAGKPYRDVL